MDQGKSLWQLKGPLFFLSCHYEGRKDEKGSWKRRYSLFPLPIRIGSVKRAFTLISASWRRSIHLIHLTLGTWRTKYNAIAIMPTSKLKRLLFINIWRSIIWHFRSKLASEISWEGEEFFSKLPEWWARRGRTAKRQKTAKNQIE